MTYPFCNIKKNSIDHSKEFEKEVEEYSRKLKDKNLPVIFSLPHLSLMAGVDIQHTINTCNSDRIEFHKRFKLKKKRGGYRVIQTPNDELKYLQRWVLKNILENIPSHNSCKGFDKKTSINENAKLHLGSEALLKIDLLRFFDSINEKRVYGIFRSIGYHPNLAVSMAKLCTIVPDGNFLSSFKKKETPLKNLIIDRNEGILAQGSPTSPKLSNLILRNLDKRFKGLSDKYDLKYSRYADDLTFSGNLVQLKKIKKIVYRIIKNESLFVNYGKTKFIKRGGQFLVTGINVQGKSTMVSNKKKNEVEHHIYHCLNNGVKKHLKASGINNRNFKDWLFGNISFVYSIEKETGRKYIEEFNKIQWPI
jgi:RNA-directed DNA polymerase